MYEYACTVDRVVDGDTVDVVLDLGFDVRFFSRVRLYGIDTPESRTRDKDEKARGLISKKFLQDSLADQDVVIKTKLKDSRGKYGRVLGTLHIEIEDVECCINNKLIEMGHAVEYHGGKRK